ncbi:MAG: FecR family protein, partial [Pseudomonadota bacterium]
VGVEVKIIPAGTVGTENDRAASQKSCVSAFRKVVIFYEHGFRKASGDMSAMATAREALKRGTAARTRAARLREAARLSAERAYQAAQAVRRLAGTAARTEARALLVYRQGDVRVSGLQTEARMPESSTAQPLQGGESIQTGPGGRASFFLADGQSTITLEENTTAAYRDEAERTLLDLVSGKVNLAIHAWRKRFEVPTPTAVCAVRGTRFSVDYDRDQGRTELVVLEGLVEVRPRAMDRAIEVPAGTWLRIGRDGALEGPRPLDVSADELRTLSF